ncbi:MAG: ATP-binding protein [Gemmataceae bacterium]
MTEPDRAAEQRVLIYAPSGRDAALARDVFARAGVAAHVCADLAAVCTELDAGAGALLTTEEAAATDRDDCLAGWLSRQPPWSDLPVLLTARPGADSPAVARAVEVLGNVTVLERPVRIAALVSAARTALRGRERQYHTRQLLLDREQTAAELRTLMDLLPVGVFIAHDPACRRITGNRAANAILRMPGAANLSKTAPPLERPTHFRPSRDGVEIPPPELPVQRAARGEVVRNEEVDQVFDDGVVVHTLISALPLLDATGTARGAVASITDITAQKRTEEALRASEEKYRTLFESIDEGFCVIEVLSDAAGRPSDYRFVEVNPAFEAQAGMRGAVGRRMLEFVPAIEPHWLENYGRVADTGEPVRFAGEYKGLHRWFEVYAFRVGDPGARRVAVLFTDITARKRMEDDLRRAVAELSEAHRFLHSALDALTSHIAVLDEAGTILAVNAAWRRFADENNYDGHAYGVGSNYLQECEPHAGGGVEGLEVAAGLRAVLAGREPYFEFEYPCHSPTEHRWFTMRVSRFLTPGPVRVVVSHEDVTTRREAEEALKDADRRKNEFLAMLAHELRNPLAPIRNSLHILRLVGGAEATGVHDMMDRQVAHMVRLVDDLLEVSRITRGKIDLRRAPVELAAVVRTAVETSRPLIDAASHTLTVDVPADGLVVDGDAVRLAQVFANLLNNAAKYTEPGGAVRVAARRVGADAVVTVSDTGAGIPPEMLARVFDLFTQIDRTDARAQGGLGIGLTLVKSLVELHGGRVAVRSDGPGKGSEFEVRLPALPHGAAPAGS